RLQAGAPLEQLDARIRGADMLDRVDECLAVAADVEAERELDAAIDSALAFDGVEDPRIRKSDMVAGGAQRADLVFEPEAREDFGYVLALFEDHFPRLEDAEVDLRDLVARSLGDGYGDARGAGFGIGLRGGDVDRGLGVAHGGEGGGEVARGAAG